MSPLVQDAAVATPDATPSIVDLPDELISAIFKLCSPRTSAHVLSSICRRFRAIALDTSSLWTTISFQLDEHSAVPPRFERDVAYLRRSRDANLNVKINWVRSIQYVNAAVAERKERQRMVHWLSTSDVHRALRLLWSHVHRIRTLVFHCDVYFPLFLLAQTFTSRRAPALEVLDLALCAPLDNSLPAPRLALFTGGMPMLKQVEFQGVHWDWIESPLGGRNLRSLHLSYMHPSMQPTAYTLSRIIRASPSLEELALLAAGPLVAAFPAAPSAAPSLRSLTLGHASAATLDAVARMAIVDSLRTLVLTGLAGLPHAPAFARAPIASLTLHRITAAPCTIVDFLRVGFPQLKSLALRRLQCTPQVLHGIARRGAAVCPGLTKLKIGGDVQLEDVHAFLALRASAGVGIANVSFEVINDVDEPAALRVETRDDSEMWTEECSAGVVLDETGDQFAQDLMDLFDD